MTTINLADTVTVIKDAGPSGDLLSGQSHMTTKKQKRAQAILSLVTELDQSVFRADTVGYSRVVLHYITHKDPNEALYDLCAALGIDKNIPAEADLEGWDGFRFTETRGNLTYRCTLSPAVFPDETGYRVTFDMFDYKDSPASKQEQSAPENSATEDSDAVEPDAEMDAEAESEDFAGEGDEEL